VTDEMMTLGSQKFFHCILNSKFIDADSPQVLTVDRTTARTLLISMTMTALVLCGWKTYIQNVMWTDNKTLFEGAVESK